jgi:hypothetical protein
MPPILRRMRLLVSLWRCSDASEPMKSGGVQESIAVAFVAAPLIVRPTKRIWEIERLGTLRLVWSRLPTSQRPL